MIGQIRNFLVRLGQIFSTAPLILPLLVSPCSAQDNLEVIVAGSDWKYDDTDADLGTDWREPEFDDSGWNSGAAPWATERAV